MFKKITVLTMAVVLCLSLLVACGKQPEANRVSVGADVTVSMTDSTFEEGTTVTAEAVTGGTLYERAKAAMADVAEQFTVFDINAVKENAKVQPSGAVEVAFPIPASFSTNVMVFYVADDGSREQLKTVVDKQARTATAELTHFSVYVLAEVAEEQTEGSQSTTTTEESTTTTTTTTQPVAVTYPKAATKNWQLMKVQEPEMHIWSLSLPDMSIGYSLWHYDEAVPDSYIQENPDEFKLYNGKYYMCGLGDGCPVESVTEDGDTVTIVAEGGTKLVLKRTSAKTMKVVSDATGMELRAGDVFTMK